MFKAIQNNEIPRVFFGGVLLLITGFISIHSTPIQAQDVPKVTAGEVVDRESLKAFVTWFTSEISSIQSSSEQLEFLQNFRMDGSDFRNGNIFLIAIDPEGIVLLHGKDPNIEGKDVGSVVDDDGTMVIQEILTADDVDGKFVEYCWDDPLDTADPRCKDSYARRYYSNRAESTVIVVGGYYQDLSGVGTPPPNISLPDVSASEVKDRLTLKQFVSGAADWLATLAEDDGLARTVSRLKPILREEGGHFRSGPLYLYIISDDGYVVFHGANPWREGRIVIDNTDFRGTPFIRDLIEIARSGGGFFDYYWDDPSVEGDEEFGTLKISYATILSETENAEYIIAGGFYRDFSTSRQANVQFIHNLPLSIPVNLYLDGVNIVENFNFQNATGYDGIPEGEHTLSILPEGVPLEQALESSLPDVMWNHNYVVAIHGSLGNVFVKSFETRTASAVENMVDVILIHGSGDLGDVDLRIIDPIDNITPTKLLANNFSLNDVSSYFTLEPGLYNVEATTRNNSERLAVFNIQVSHKYRNETLVLNLSGSKDAPKDAFDALTLYGVDLRGDKIPSAVITDVEAEITELPTEFTLHGNYPNPFNPSTQIQFDLPEAAQVSLQVMDILGREVMSLPAQEYDAGSNRTIELNALSLASGTYVYRMIATGVENRYVKTGRMLLMK